MTMPGFEWCKIFNCFTHSLGMLQIAAIFLLPLTACQPVGPDYIPPQTNFPATWHAELQQGLSPEAIDNEQLSQWWQIFDDPVLSELVTQLISNNLDAKLAVAKIKESRARQGLSQALLFPGIDANGSASKNKGSENAGGGSSHSRYAVSFDAGWEIDVFGGTRRSIEAAEADLEVSRENLRDILVSLTAEMALNYLELRIIQKRLAVAEENIAIQQETFDIARWRCQAGLSNELALQQARSTLENTRAQIPVLRSNLEETKNRIAILTGQIPGKMHYLLDETRPIPTIPSTVAVGVPAETLRQRPDIRKAERSLAAQTARIGAATADLYPKFRLSGSIGLESLKSSTLFSSGSETWNIVPGVSWNIFDAGTIRRNIQVQSALQEQYLIAYEASILTALEEVEKALTSYAEEQLRRDRLVAAVDAARQAQELTAQEYSAGLTDFLAVLVAQRSLLSLDDQLAQSEGTVTANLVRLYKTLGGGWNSFTTRQLLNEEKYNGQF